MLRTLFQQISDAFDNNEKGDQSDLSIALATAALLVEMERADFSNDPREQQVIESLLKQHFHLNDDTVASLLNDAHSRADDSVSLHEFTGWLNKHAEPDEKQRMVAMLWQVAYADNQLDPEEEWLVRKIADLLYVPHEAFIRTKLSAQTK